MFFQEVMLQKDSVNNTPLLPEYSILIRGEIRRVQTQVLGIQAVHVIRPSVGTVLVQGTFICR